MQSPDQRIFEADLQSANYRNGVFKGLWGEPNPEECPEGASWPNAYFWMAAAPRPGAPDRYYVALDMSGYRGRPPTGPLWDPEKRQTLEISRWPKGIPGSRFAQVFRTDGFSFAGRALYHPYDRSPLSDHANWVNEHPNHVWTHNHTIVDYLEEFQSLLASKDYVGV